MAGPTGARNTRKTTKKTQDAGLTPRSSRQAARRYKSELWLCGGEFFQGGHGAGGAGARRSVNGGGEQAAADPGLTGFGNSIATEKRKREPTFPFHFIG